MKINRTEANYNPKFGMNLKLSEEFFKYVLPNKFTKDFDELALAVKDMTPLNKELTLDITDKHFTFSDPKRLLLEIRDNVFSIPGRDRFHSTIKAEDLTEEFGDKKAPKKLLENGIPIKKAKEAAKILSERYKQHLKQLDEMKDNIAKKQISPYQFK